MKNDIHARHSHTACTGNVTAEDSHDSLHVTPHYIRLVILNLFQCIFEMSMFNEGLWS